LSNTFSAFEANYTRRRGGYITHDWILLIQLDTLAGQKLDTFYPHSEAFSHENNYFIDEQAK
jgi:hypothetical protein